MTITGIMWPGGVGGGVRSCYVREKFLFYLYKLYFTRKAALANRQQNLKFSAMKVLEILL